MVHNFKPIGKLYTVYSDVFNVIKTKSLLKATLPSIETVVIVSHFRTGHDDFVWNRPPLCSWITKEPVTSAVLYINEILFERSYGEFYIRQLYT